MKLLQRKKKKEENNNNNILLVNEILSQEIVSRERQG